MIGETLRLWLKQANLDEGKRSDDLMSDEQEELQRLRREIRILREERGILKNNRSLLRTGDRPDPVSVYEFVEREKDCHTVARLCRALDVPAISEIRLAPPHRSLAASSTIDRTPCVPG